MYKKRKSIHLKKVDDLKKIKKKSNQMFINLNWFKTSERTKRAIKLNDV